MKESKSETWRNPNPKHEGIPNDPFWKIKEFSIQVSNYVVKKGHHLELKHHWNLLENVRVFPTQPTLLLPPEPRHDFNATTANRGQKKGLRIALARRFTLSQNGYGAYFTCFCGRQHGQQFFNILAVVDCQRVPYREDYDCSRRARVTQPSRRCYMNFDSAINRAPQK